MPSVDLSELERLVNTLQDKSLLARAASNSLANSTESLASYATKNARFKNPTGATVNATQAVTKGLRSSIFVDKKDIPYIEPLYEGSKPHIIRPKDTGALSFVIGSTRIFAKEVRHPGYKGNPFIQRAWDKNKEVFKKQYTEDLTEQIQDLI